MTPYGKGALAHACSRVRQAAAGQRNAVLFREAAGLFQLVAGGELEREPVWDQLLEAASSIGLDRREATGTLRSADKAGQTSPRSKPSRNHARRPPPRAQIPEHPPGATVDWLWRKGSTSVLADEAACNWLSSRGLRPELVAVRGLARVIDSLPKVPPQMPRARTDNGWAPAFVAGYRVALALYDVTAAPRSLVLRSCRKDAKPKTLYLKGSRKGLVLANRAARAILRGEVAAFDGARLEVVIVEGEVDFLTAATEELDGDTVRAVFGVGSGAWRIAFGIAVPERASVIIATDHDPPGDRYAAEVGTTLPSQRIGRWAPAVPGEDLADAGGVRGGTVQWR